MKISIKLISVILLASIISSSCSITKRKHRKGYHIETSKRYSSVKSSTKKESPTTKNLTYKTTIEETKTPPSNILASIKSITIKENKPSLFKKKKSVETLKKQTVLLKRNETPHIQLKKETTKLKSIKEQPNTDKPITKKEARSYLGLTFTLLLLLSPLYLSILSIIYNIKGLKSDNRKMSIWCLIITILILGIYIWSVISLGYFYIFGLIIPL